jgi:hypothetical protein
MTIIEPDTIGKVPHKTSKYTGVSWNKDCKKWKAEFVHHAKTYYGGLFDHEENAAMKINLICDKIKIERKNPETNEDAIQKKINPNIDQENIVKMEDESIRYALKDECEKKFMMTSKDEKISITTASSKRQKRKRKNDAIINDTIE